jgi:ketosteroid isomerase-like protein
MMFILRAAGALLLLIAIPAAARAETPQAAVEGLLEADRAFAAIAAAAADPANGLAPMFDADVVVPLGGRHVSGRTAVIEAMRESPNFRDGRMRWTPIRAGVSADGTHGFTLGYVTVDGAEPPRRDRKYLAYWVRRPDGWRAIVYRQFFRPPGEIDTAMLAPSLPAAGPAPPGDPAAERSLAAAEQAFSDLAQQVGLREAFGRNGRPDATHAGDQAAFRIGLDQIIADFPEGESATRIHWNADRAIVAPSGDLGVTIGTIRPNGAVQEGQPAAIPFFTIWRRDGPDEPWRYIAE